MYQEIEIIGNLGRAPEMRYFQDGTAVTNFSVAVNQVKGTGDERTQETVWFRVSVFGKQAEACNEYLVQGQRVLVKGKLSFDPASGGPKLFTRQDGTVGTAFEIRANYGYGGVIFLSKPGQGSDGEPASSRQGGQASEAYGDEEDEIPF
jgi:single-strand DNA-binding protein